MRVVTRYNEEFKLAVLEKVLLPNAPSVVELARQNNVPTATLHTWIHKMRNKQKGAATNKELT